METRANYVLIGAFTLAGLLGIVGFFLWFARIELDRQFAYYDIRFPSVSGLSTASDVRFSGLPVGQVVSVGLAPDGEGTVLVRVEIDAETPVRIDSIATIEAQGVTGVSFVGISPGSPDAPLLERDSGGAVPEIEAGRSTLQSLSDDAPRLLDEALTIMEGLSGLVTEENSSRIERTLTNIEEASNNFAAALEDFSTVTSSVSDFARQIDSFNATLEELTGALSGVLATADDTLVSVGTLAEDSRGSLEVLNETLNSTRALMTEAERYVAGDLTEATGEVTRVVTAFGAQIEVIGAETLTMLDALATTGTTATARLTEAEATLAATDAAIARLLITLDAVDEAADTFDTLMAEDGAALVAEARAAIAQASNVIDTIGTVAETDLPVMIADLRSATSTVSNVVSEVGATLSSASGRVDTLMETADGMVARVTTTFANANDTLSAINGALETGNTALEAATRVFDGADRLVNEEAAAIVANLRATIGRLDGVIAGVAEDIPAISADLRAASETAEAAFAAIGRTVSSSAGPIETFATTGLPDYTRLAQEARTLVNNLDALTTQIQRDPARFFLNRQTPDFRR